VNEDYAVNIYKAFEVREEPEKNFHGSIVEKSMPEPQEGSVIIDVHYSSVNYKDALSASGSKAVTREYPHVPGIDAVGKVLASTDPNFVVGEEVIVTGYDLGMNTAGGFGQQICVPASWVAKLPFGLSLRDSMVLGTAGLTAGLCVDKLLQNGVTPEAGKVLVTGATGGVGIVACALLAKLGFDVVASTGKLSEGERLKALGVREVISREALSEENPRPLLKESYAAAVDVAGGATLVNVIKSLSYGGSVAACGLVDSPAINVTVLPFILRGVNLLGVDSVELPLSKKQEIWALFASEWSLTAIDSLAETIVLTELPAALAKVLAGGAVGRYLLDLKA
jgi:alcohol dehydrogenase